MRTKRVLVWIVAAVVVAPAVAAAQGLDAAKIDQALGRSGQKIGDVYKVGFPRTDLRVVVQGVSVKPGFALGSWAAFSGTDANGDVMGDLVLLQDEVNPVMSKLRAAGFEISAVHNHLLDAAPQVMYMHYMGHGPLAALAGSLRAALAVSKTPLAKPAAAPAAATPPPAWVGTVQTAIGHTGSFAGGVLSIGVPRAGAVTMDGMTIAPAEGVAESMNFQEAGAGRIAATGDFVLIAQEVNPVISALQAHSIQVEALHNHMLTEQPRLFFMHFWAVGTPVSVGEGLKAALSHIAIK